MSTEALLVLTTLGSAQDAQEFVHGLVEDRLIACGTVLPAASIYRWKGDVLETDEFVVLLKTEEAKWDALVAAVESRHPYDVPELLAFPVERGARPYLEWVHGEVRT
jgi:periplasmic divalent cation tolerance protein